MNATFIIGTYCWIDDTLKAIGHRDHHHVRVTTAEILTIAVVSAKYFQNHHERAVGVMRLLGYIPRLSVSRFNRRVHQAWDLMADILALWSQERSEAQTAYVIDTMPLPVCHKSRAEQCRKTPQVKGYLGRCSAKSEWFFGWRLHWVCDGSGFPIAFDLVPAVWHELTTLQVLIADLPAGSHVFGDGAYVSWDEESLAALIDIRIISKPHKRQKRQLLPWQETQLRRMRSRIESQHSVLEKMGVQRLHAVTAEGFAIKVYASLMTLALDILID